jgi:hypothetical protein
MTDPALKLVDENGELRTPGCQDCKDKAARLAGLQGDYDAIVRELATVIRQRDALKQDKDEKMRKDKMYPEAEALFEEWQRECGHPNAKLDPARIRLALGAVRRYKDHREKLSWVIQYGKHLPYVDENGVRHDSFGLLFRDSEHIERYANMYARWRGRRSNGV